MKKILEFKWQIVAIALLAAGFVMSRAGAAALMPLVRVLVPVLIVLLFVRLVKKRVSGAMSELMRKQMEAAGIDPQSFGAGRSAAGAAAGSGKGGGKKVIDLCPKCGGYMGVGHRCKRS